MVKARTGDLAHFGIAVILAFALTRHFSWREVPAYIAALTISSTVTLDALWSGPISGAP